MRLFLFVFSFFVLLCSGYSEKIITVATHNGIFHADDVVSVALLKIYFQQENIRLKIVRSRDENIFKKADIVLDVGGIYDPKNKRFDHHQNSFLEKRENGIPYASAGLIFKEYGVKLFDGHECLAKDFDDSFISAIDAHDNGVTSFIAEDGTLVLSKSIVYNGISFSNLISDFLPKETLDENLDRAFMEAVDFSVSVILRKIDSSKLMYKEQKKLKNAIAKFSSDSQFIVFEQYFKLWKKEVCKWLPQVKYAIFPGVDKNFNVIAVPFHERTLMLKKPFPKHWRGKSGEELQKITGEKKAIFCHKEGFLLVCEDIETAEVLAERASKNEEKEEEGKLMDWVLCYRFKQKEKIFFIILGRTSFILKDFQKIEVSSFYEALEKIYKD